MAGIKRFEDVVAEQWIHTWWHDDQIALPCIPLFCSLSNHVPVSVHAISMLEYHTHL